MWVQRYASTLEARAKPTPRQQMRLPSPAAVQVAEAGVQAPKSKGGRNGKQPKRGHGGAGGQQVKASAARQTDVRARREARESVRGWIRAARVDEACKGALLPWHAAENVTRSRV